MSLRIWIAVLVLSLVSTASAAVPQSAALGANQQNEAPQNQTHPFLLCSDNAGATFMLLKTDGGYRLLALLGRMDAATGTEQAGFTVDIAANLNITKQGSNVVSLDEDALAKLAAGTAKIDPVAYLQSAVAMKQLSSIVADARDNAETPADAASSMNSYINSQPELYKAIQDRLGGAQKANASPAEKNPFSLVAPGTTHKQVILTLAKDDNGYHFQILVAGDKPAGSPDTAMSVTIDGQDVEAAFDEEVLNGLALETQALEPVADETDAGETGASIAPADVDITEH